MGPFAAFALQAGAQAALNVAGQAVGGVRKFAQGGYKEYTGSEAIVGQAQIPEYLPYNFGNISGGGGGGGQLFGQVSYTPGRGFRGPRALGPGPAGGPGGGGGGPGAFAPGPPAIGSGARSLPSGPSPLALPTGGGMSVPGRINIPGAINVSGRTAPGVSFASRAASRGGAKSVLGAVL